MTKKLEIARNSSSQNLLLFEQAHIAHACGFKTAKWVGLVSGEVWSKPENPRFPEKVTTMKKEIGSSHSKAILVLVVKKGAKKGYKQIILG